MGYELLLPSESPLSELRPRTICYCTGKNSAVAKARRMPEIELLVNEATVFSQMPLLLDLVCEVVFWVSVDLWSNAQGLIFSLFAEIRELFLHLDDG
jgi:hypothetical protein